MYICHRHTGFHRRWKMEWKYGIKLNNGTTNLFFADPTRPTVMDVVLFLLLSLTKLDNKTKPFRGVTRTE